MDLIWCSGILISLMVLIYLNDLNMEQKYTGVGFISIYGFPMLYSSSVKWIKITLKTILLFVVIILWPIFCLVFKKSTHKGETNQQRRARLQRKTANYIRAFVLRAYRVEQKPNRNKDAVYLDSGSSKHIFRTADLIEGLIRSLVPVTVEMADGKQKEMKNTGTCKARIKDRLFDSFYMPELGFNLMSVAELCKAGYTCIFTPRKSAEPVQVQVVDENRKTFIRGIYEESDGLYRLCTDPDEMLELQRILRAKTSKSKQKKSKSKEKSTTQSTEQSLDKMDIDENNPTMGEKDSEGPSIVKNATSRSLLEWHLILGHRDISTIRKMAREGHLEISKDDWDKSNGCSTCHKAKAFRNVNYSPSKPTTRPLELIHVDTNGPWAIPTLSQKAAGGSIEGSVINYIPGKSIYYVVFIDDFTSYAWTYFYSTKDEYIHALEDCILKMHNQSMHGHRIARIRMDGAWEFKSQQVREQLEGVKFELSAPYAHEQNGKAERVHRSLTSIARTMMIDSGLPEEFWGEAIRAATYIRNRMPSKGMRVINSDRDENEEEESATSPYEALTGNKPHLDSVHPFGCGAYIFRPKEKQTKRLSEPRATEGILLGNIDGCDKQWLYWDINRREICVTAYLRKAMDGYFPARENFREYFPYTQLPETGKQDTFFRKDSLLSDSNGYLSFLPRTSEKEEEDTMDHSDIEMTDVNVSTEDKIQSIANLRRSERPRKLTKRLMESSIQYRKALVALRSQSLEIPMPNTPPQNYQDIVSSPFSDLWYSAMDDEIEAMKTNKVWERVSIDTIPKSIKPLRNRWVYTLKQNPDGTTRPKARLVIKGFLQRDGKDYDSANIFAPVVYLRTIRMALALAAALPGAQIHQMDVKTAFLNAPLEESIYMKLPEGYDDSETDVLRLKRALYGLKQAPREWNREIDRSLRNFGFCRCEADRCLYIHPEHNLILLLYVDDMLIIGRDIRIINKIKKKLAQKYTMTDLGIARRFLGIDIEYKDENDASKGIHLSQSHVINELLEECRLKECRPTTTPLPNQTYYEKATEDDLPVDIENRRFYQSIVGKLNYLVSGTRPDIAYAVSHLAQFSTHPCERHWQGIQHLLKYLKGTAGLGLVYHQSRCSTVTDDEGEEIDEFNLDLHGYSDSDWGSCTAADRRSCTGYLFKLGDSAALTWASRLQQHPALSSTNAEYVAAATSAQEALWLRQILYFMRSFAKIECRPKENNLGTNGFQTYEGLIPTSVDAITVPMEPTKILVDNNGAIALTRNPEFHKRSKHIDIKWHFIRSYVESGDLRTEYISTNEMTADILTKPLGPAKHRGHMQGLGLVELEKFKQ